MRARLAAGCVDSCGLPQGAQGDKHVAVDAMCPLVTYNACRVFSAVAFTMINDDNDINNDV